MTRADDRVKMTVDQTTCIGAGQCEMLAMETFRIDDETVVAVVIGDGLLPPDAAQVVVDACPVQAISIIDEALE